MSDPARRPARYEDLFDLPEHVVGEILGGELVVTRRPASGHAFASSTMGGELSWRFQRGGDGPGGWWIVDEPELHLGEDVLVPDLAGWRKERVPVFPADVTGWELAPDWICEVLSPSTTRIDRIRKLPIYAREGVTHAWLLEPVQRWLEVLRLEAGRWVLVGQYEGEARVRAEPFEAVELALGAWWAGGG